MDINIYVNQKKINPLCSSAIAEYVKRLSPYCNMKIVCAPGHVKYTPGHNSAHYAVIRASQKVVSYGYGNWNHGYEEYQSISDSTSTGSARTISSEDFASQINAVTTNGTSKLNYYIGYPSEDTNHMDVFAFCTIKPSDEMTALLLSEQVYRAYTILNNITYHK